ncbi:MAG: hypothetical protein Q8877_03510, partial [Sweet potato little leaf phytoplasma]|nr:hypothetical protein [Sweet potato little leaf phytoplasma]
FFFDGGKEKNLPNIKKILIPSPKVDTYDQKPEMSEKGKITFQFKNPSSSIMLFKRRLNKSYQTLTCKKLGKIFKQLCEHLQNIPLHQIRSETFQIFGL